MLSEFGDKYIVVAVEQQAEKHNILITLNKTAGFVWQLLENEISYDDIINAMNNKYDIDLKTAKADLDSFLTAVRSKDLLDE